MRIESLEKRAAYLEETLASIRQYIDVIVAEEEGVTEKEIVRSQHNENEGMKRVER